MRSLRIPPACLGGRLRGRDGGGESSTTHGIGVYLWLRNPCAQEISMLTPSGLPPISQTWITREAFAVAKAAAGDPSAQPIYEAVGKALSLFEAFEDSLQRVYGTVIGSHWPTGPISTFGSIEGSVARRKHLLARVRVFFKRYPDPELEQDFRSWLRKSVADAAERRNEIAHGKVVQVTNADSSCGYFLCPTNYASDTGWVLSGSRYLFNSSIINNYAEAFQKLSDQAFIYEQELGRLSLLSQISSAGSGQSHSIN